MKKTNTKKVNQQPTHTDIPQYYCEKEAAALLGFNAAWLAQKRRDEKIEFSDFGHKGIRYTLAQINAFAEKHTVRPGAHPHKHAATGSTVHTGRNTSGSDGKGVSRQARES